MTILLDTHVLLWILADSSKLSPAAVTAYKNLENEIYVSAATFWEIGIKISLGKLTLRSDWPETLRLLLERYAFRWLAIELEHCVRVAGLPFLHRDPFDRLLVVQALCGGMSLMTADKTLAGYGIEIVW